MRRIAQKLDRSDALAALRPPALRRENGFSLQPPTINIHLLYQRWVKGKVALLGDAAHPMMPHQSQGACQAIEDAAALSIIFSKDFGYTNDVKAGLELYEHIRKPRATRVQTASARATENINERIGFSSLNAHDAKLAAAANKLTGEYIFDTLVLYRH